MTSIHILDKNLANQIAAWEVVERPLSVVKELFENALDAGATSIKVEIVQWGKKSITITDNGQGMQKADLEICLERYATSKIQTLDDLYHVMTFGFRGEALSSISSVSKMTISSKYHTSQDAYQLTFDSIGWQKISPISFDSGTQIIVEDLFYNTPARLNYLKTDNTEISKISSYLWSMLLIHSDVWIEFISDGKKILKANPGENLEKRIFAYYGEEMLQNTLDLLCAGVGISITWKITSPKISYPNKNRQHLFVNKRPISSPLIYKAISDAYNRFIPHGNFPWFILNLSVDPTIIDVNVHPRKQEIRFENESQIFKCVYHGILDTLEKSALVSAPISQEEMPQTSPSSFQLPSSPKNYYTGSGTKFTSYSPYKNTQPHPSQTLIGASIELTKNLLWDPLQDVSIGDLHYTRLGKIVGQAFQSYILVEQEHSLVVFDQHALAERVLYEKFLKNDTKPSFQQLLVPEMIQATPEECQVFAEYASIFHVMWFEGELLPHGVISITSLPDFLKKEDLQEVLLWIFTDILSWNTLKSKTLDEVKNKIFAYSACRGAIKFWHKLSLFEMNALLKDATSWYSSTCPHGRPVVFEISLDELKNKYER